MSGLPRPFPRFTRRRVLQAGGLSVLGLGLPSFLAARAEAASRRDAGEKSCLFIVQYGGAPQQDMWDLKPDAPEDIRGAFRPIDTAVPGIRICEKMPLLAQRAGRYSLIRSMTTNDGGHDGAMHICMTGYPRPTDQTPYFGSVVSRLAPPSRDLPSYVWIQNIAGDVRPWYLTGGSLGMAHGPLRVGTDLDNPANPAFRFTAFDPPKDVTGARQDARFSLLRTLSPDVQGAAGALGATADDAERRGLRSHAERGNEGGARGNEETAAFRRMQEKAHELVTGSAARRAFDLSLERPETRDRYGRHPLGQNLLMARRLIEAGVRLVTVVAWTGTPAGEKFRNVQTWDMHGVLYKPDDSIFGSSAYGLSWALPNVDQALSALLDDLSESGLLDSTVLCMVGEFGRTPKVNARGRDHWPNCYSAMVAGGGFRGGTATARRTPTPLT